MTPEAFISKWSESTTKERAAAQEHFIDLCSVLGEQTPNQADPHGEWYAFEKGVEKTGAGRGWADVWKRGCFGWEYKSKSGGRSSTMSGALKQLQLYALALESPPLLIVSDIDTIEIHTAFQNAVQEVYVLELGDLSNPDKLALLKSAFTDPERLRPKCTRNQITADAAKKFAELAYALRGDRHDPQVVAHFLNKILFCMFAEDAGVLKTGLFTDIAEKSVEHPENFDVVIKRLFQAMQTGGPFGTDIIDWFNGGLFDDDATVPLTLAQITIVRDLARMDWSHIEPAIFGTLFERGLDPAKRSQLGAHYTDPESIMRLVNPTIVEPLLREWKDAKGEIAKQMERMERVKTKETTKKARIAARNAFHAFLERLRNFRVLDPACGSGNFLYLSLHALKDIEHQVNIEAEALGMERQNPMVGPETVHGIEINAYAAELARVTVWIGEIQWMLSHGYSLSKNPILKSLDNIEQRDAILSSDGIEPDWPKADVIVGNPPFLGSQKLLGELGEEYTEKLRTVYKNRVPANADLVTYWYEKARNQLVEGKADYVGLVATQSIRKGTSYPVLKRVAESCTIYNAWADEAWVNEGAAVRVSLICFAASSQSKCRLNDVFVDSINSDLTNGDSTSIDITSAKPQTENIGKCFQGSKKVGAFNIPGDQARNWLTLPTPHGKPNSDVLKPYWNGLDLTRRNRDMWIVDFGLKRTDVEAALYEAPYEYIFSNVKPARDRNNRKSRRENWWKHGDGQPAMRNSISGLKRFIVTPEVAKHRLFVWLEQPILPDCKLMVVAREDDQTFGILQSRFHEIWALRAGSRHGDGTEGGRPRYNPTSTFLTFPFPTGLTPDLDPTMFSNKHTSSIAKSVQDLVSLRENWLNPPEWVERVPEVLSGYPDRLIPKPEYENELKQRTLTNLYNAKPTWLMNIHQQLDEAVAAAYGLSTDLNNERILAYLLELNLSRST